MLHGSMEVTREGHLSIGGCDVVELAKRYKTPLYIFDEEYIREIARLYKNEFEKRYDDVKVLYASKAFLTKAMAALIDQEGICFDVCSQGEMYTVMQAGVSPDKIYYHGNNKTAEELEFALEAGIARIMSDNIDELSLLNQIAKEKGKKAHVILRLTPGIEAHTHEYIKTGQIDSKFGVAISTGDAMRAVKHAFSLDNIVLHGIHCHIGSQIFDLDCFEGAANVMLSFAKKVKDETGHVFDQLDLGGGLGIKYVEGDAPAAISELAEVITSSIKKMAQEYEMPIPSLLIEPGRSMIGEAGTTIYTVGCIKNIEGVRKYVSIDGGMTDNPRVALYQAKYDAVLANKVKETPCEVVTIAGHCCESGDILIKDIMLPKIEIGDILATFSTGAYNYAMASNYNRYARPAAVLVKDGVSKLIIRRESLEDLVRNDIIPEDL